MKKLSLALLCSGLCLAAAGCEQSRSTATEEQAQTTEQTMRDAQQRVGMPRITNFTEKRLANQILELRDQPNLSTYSYISDLNGHLHCIGRSIGFGLPYGTQITNPQQMLLPGISERGVGIMPQAEPNGLFSPDSAAASWVLLVGEDGRPHPTYIESDVTVSLFPLRSAVVADPC